MSHSIPEFDTAIQRARLRIAYDGLPASLVLSALLGAVVALVLYIKTPGVDSLVWYGAFVAVVVLRAGVHKMYCRCDPSQLNPRQWSRWFFIATLGGGAMWGSLCIFAFPEDGLLQMLLAFTLAGTSAAAVTSLSAERAAAIGFVAASIVPLAARLLLEQSPSGIAMGIMVLLFLVTVIGSISRFHQQLVHMVVARLDAEMRRRELLIAKEEMQQLNDRMHIATRTAKAGIWEWDLITQRHEWDDQVYEMYGITADSQPPGYDAWRSRIHPEDLARTEAALRHMFSDGGEFTIEYRVVWPDGTERSIKASGLTQRDAQDRPIRVIGMNWDITELRRVERMKSEFVSIVSHELRTPLTSIRGALGLVASGATGAVTERCKQMLQLANRNADRLSILIDDILDIERIESTKLRFELARQPLQHLLEQSIAANATYAAMHSVTFALRANTTREVEVDTNRLLQVMANLLSNAVKFSPSGSTVTVDVRENDTHARVEIQDTGPGISTEFQAQIFGKFCQADSSDTRSKGGSGLGLAISKAIIDQLNGRIGFDTVPGKGATFWFDLPLPGVQECGTDEIGVPAPPNN